jgi:hypothetical protein
MRPRPFRPRLELLDDRCLPSFSPAVNYPTGDSPGATATGDFNGDGVPDVAVAANGSSGASRILLGNGDGTLRSVGSFEQRIIAQSMVAGDLTGDGVLDLALVGDSSPAVHVLTGNGDGTFQAPLQVELGGVPDSVGNPGVANPGVVVAGDLNADGTLDLVVGGSRSWAIPDDYGAFSLYTLGEVNVLLGHGDGTFAAPLHYSSGLVTDFTDVALADLNGDGNLDVAAAGVNDSWYGQYSWYGALQAFLGTGDGGLQSSAALGTNDLRSVAAADFNGDGKTDLVASYYWSGDTFALFVGNGDGTFQAERAIPGDLYRASLAVGDFNRDGRIDIAAAGQFGNDVRVLLGKGDGSFRASEGYPAGSDTVDLALVDLNGDGFADLVTANNFSDDASVLLNDGMWPPLDAPTVTVSDAAILEGQTGTRYATVTVRLSAASSGTVTVGYSTAAGTATAGADYQAVSGTVSFAPGQTNRSILVPILGDRVPEPDETFAVTLGAATGASVADGRAVVTIRDDEPRVTITDVTKKEGHAGTTLFVFTVTLSAAYDVPVTVHYATADGTAKAGEDYTAASGTLTFSPGQTSKTITVAVRADKQSEADETFFVNLSGAPNASIPDGTGLGTILNDDRR